MRILVCEEKHCSKERERERERENHINLSPPINLQNIYILPIQTHMRKLQLRKKKKCGLQERFYGKTIGEYK